MSKRKRKDIWERKNYKEKRCSLEDLVLIETSQPTSTSASESVVVVTPRRSTPSARPSPRALYVPNTLANEHNAIANLQYQPRVLTHPPDRILPEVRRRAQQEPAQASPRRIRPHTPRCRQPTMRAQEVRRSRCPRPVPEVLQIDGEMVSHDEKHATDSGSRSGFTGLQAWLWALTETLLPLCARSCRTVV